MITVRRGNISKRAKRRARFSAAPFTGPAVILSATPEGLFEGIEKFCQSRRAKPGEPELVLSVTPIEGPSGVAWFVAWLVPDAPCGVGK